MRRLVATLACALMLLAGHAVWGADGTAAFDAANRLYEQGNFGDAAVAYENLLKSGQSPALYFNLGNAYFKSGQAGRAIAAYRRAEQLAPRDPDLRANLQFVRSQLQGPTGERGTFENWLHRLTLNEWAILAAIPFWLCLLLLALTQLRPKLRGSLQTATWLSGASAIVLIGLLLLALQTQARQIAVVVADDAVVRNGPLDESPSAFNIHDGAELELLDRKNDWVQVRINSRVGWIRRNQVTIL